MAHAGTPYFLNDAGLREIRIGAKEFKCMGASPPYDHPHVFLDMGGDTEIICPYCSTLFRYDAGLPAGGAEPSSAVYHPEAA